MTELANIEALMAHRVSRDRSFQDYRSDSAVAATGWPHDALEQWPFDHWDNAGFKDDYGTINPRDVVWRLEIVTAEELSEMPTGDADAGCIEEFAKDPDHWSGNRGPDVSRRWKTDGTWLRPPILIDRRLLNPPGSGLQVVEGTASVSCEGACFMESASRLSTGPGSDAPQACRHSIEPNPSLRVPTVQRGGQGAALWSLSGAGDYRRRGMVTRASARTMPVVGWRCTGRTGPSRRHRP